MLQDIETWVGKTAELHNPEDLSFSHCDYGIVMEIRQRVLGCLTDL